MVTERVLITGINSFTGPYVQQALEANGHQVYGLVNHQEAVTDTCYFSELADIETLSQVVATVKPTVVIHLAAVSFVAHSDVSDIYQSNVVGTRNLLQALADSGSKLSSIILASSANVYGNTLVEPIVENTVFTPANDYAVSKVAMEYMADTWRDRFPITIVRPFNYTGVGQSERFLIPKIVSHFVRGEKRIELGNIEVYRDFSDVRVVAAAYAGLVEANTAGEKYNICSGTAHSLGDILDYMTEIAGYRIDVDVNPAFVRSNEVKRLVGSGQKLHAAVGGLESISIKSTLQWMYLHGVECRT